MGRPRKPLLSPESTRVDRVKRSLAVEGPPGSPPMPASVERDPIARAEWVRVLPDLATLGTLSKVDGPILAFYCLSWSTAERAEAEVAEFGILVPSAAGSKKLNPAVAVARDARAHAARFASMLGLSAEGRAKLKNPAIADADPLEAILTRRANVVG